MWSQSRVPDEIIIVDAGSKDGTWELLQQEASRKDRAWRMISIQEDRCNVARGRDLAIDASSGHIIVSTDIGCDWDEQWLDELVRPFEIDPAVDLVNGSWAVSKAHLEGAWAITEWALKGDQRLEANAASYSSSRSIAYRKRCWQALGKYPEDLTLAGDDAVFQCLIAKALVPRVGAPVVRCWWHRHTTLKGFLKEAFRYGLGDGEAAIHKKDVVLIGGRIGMEIVGLVLGVIGLLPIVKISPWIGLFCLSLAGVSIGLKVLKLRRPAARLRAEGLSYPMLRLLVFTYGTKLHWLRGYLQGLQRGVVHCQQCRLRLKAMTPVLYRKRLDSLWSEV